MHPGSLPSPISAQIRSLRKERGWTLSELAERVGTSAATMHRYESGWDRFEIPTLRKIAAALGARLEVRLVPSSPEALDPYPDEKQVMDALSSLFWDRNLEGSDLKDHPGWVLARVLRFGSLDQVRLARAYFGDAAVRAAVRRREVDVRTRSFWSRILS